jgi:hypothetical protein
MTRPPLFMKFRIKGQGPRFGCWIPIFLLAPFLLVLLAVALPALLVAALILWPFGWERTALGVLPAVFRILHALPGLKIDVDTGNERIDIRIV